MHFTCSFLQTSFVCAVQISRADVAIACEYKLPVVLSSSCMPSKTQCQLVTIVHQINISAGKQVSTPVNWFVIPANEYLPMTYTKHSKYYLSKYVPIRVLILGPMNMNSSLPFRNDIAIMKCIMDRRHWSTSPGESCQNQWHNRRHCPESTLLIFFPAKSTELRQLQPCQHPRAARQEPSLLLQLSLVLFQWMPVLIFKLCSRVLARKKVEKVDGSVVNKFQHLLARVSIQSGLAQCWSQPQGGQHSGQHCSFKRRWWLCGTLWFDPRGYTAAVNASRDATGTAPARQPGTCSQELSWAHGLPYCGAAVN